MHYLVILAFSCRGTSELQSSIEEYNDEAVKTPNYALIKIESQLGILVLFICFGCNAENTISEFNTVILSTANGFSIAAIDYNQKLFLNSEEKKDLCNELIKIITENNLPKIKYNYWRIFERQNRGYNKNGEKHPDSWSIIHEKDIVKWMIK